MKKIVIVCLASLVTSLGYTQKLKESEVPVVVKESFTKRFAKAVEVTWSKESDTEFEAEFKAGGQSQSANFDQSGKWLVTETEIKKAELPQAVMATIAKEFAGFKIEEIEKAETFDSGMFYEVALEKGKVNYEIQISADGQVLKKEEKKEKGEDKD